MKKQIFVIAIIALSFTCIQYSIFTQWQQQAQLIGLGDGSPRISVADSSVVWVAGGISGPKIYRSVNGGINWTGIPAAGLPFSITAISARDSLIAFVGDGAGSFNGGNAKFYKTTNAGQNWIFIDSSGGTRGYFNDIQFSKSNPQAGVAMCDPENGVGGPFNLYKTTDGGLTWVRTRPPGRPSCYGFYYSAFVIDFQFYGFIVVSPYTLYQYPFITSNGGSNWFYGNDSMLVTDSGDLAFSDNKLNGIMVSGSRMPVIKRTTDGGYNWSNVNTGVPGGAFSGVCWVSGSDVAFIWGTGSTAGGVIRSDNNGANWTIQNTSSVNSIMEIDYATNGNRLIGYAINAAGVVLKSVQEIIPIGIKPIGNEVPNQFYLYQNYPNPFNPSTKIKFALPLVAQTILSVYDVLGRKVAVLVNDELRPGSYVVEWDADKFSSGVYYYQLTVSSEQLAVFKETKKMVLVK